MIVVALACYGFNAVAAGLPAARVSDVASSSVGSGGVILSPGANTVLIGSLPAARITDQATCADSAFPHPVTVAPIVTGSSTVLIQGLGAARTTDTTSHPCIITGPGSPTVLIGN